MTVRLYARIMAMGQDVIKNQCDDFLKSNTFKENIKRRIQGGLLDPNIPYYVRGCTARFVVSYTFPYDLSAINVNTQSATSGT
jgi:hypothetical protein